MQTRIIPASSRRWSSPLLLLLLSLSLASAFVPVLRSTPAPSAPVLRRQPLSARPSLAVTPSPLFTRLHAAVAPAQAPAGVVDRLKTVAKNVGATLPMVAFSTISGGVLAGSLHAVTGTSTCVVSTSLLSILLLTYPPAHLNRRARPLGRVAAPLHWQAVVPGHAHWGRVGPGPRHLGYHHGHGGLLPQGPSVVLLPQHADTKAVAVHGGADWRVAHCDWVAGVEGGRGFPCPQGHSPRVGRAQWQRANAQGTYAMDKGTRRNGINQ